MLLVSQQHQRLLLPLWIVLLGGAAVSQQHQRLLLPLWIVLLGGAAANKVLL
jgi:hypothetical protein